VSSGPSHAHASVGAQLAVILSGPARAAGLEPTLEHGAYSAVEHSGLIELGRADLLERIDWPSASA